MSATISFSPSGNFNQFDANNMLGAMLARSMRISSGRDPFGDAVRQTMPTFEDRYNLYRQMDIDRYGSEDEASRRTRVLNSVNYNLPPEAWKKRLEERWRSQAARDMLSYKSLQDQAIQNRFNKPSWAYY